MPSARPDNIFLQQRLERLITQAVATIFKFAPLYAVVKYLVDGKLLHASLMCLAAFWATRYHNAVENELRLLSEAFEDDRFPHYFADLFSAATIRWMNILFLIGFVSLFFASAYPLLFCVIGMFISTIDQAGIAFVIINYRQFCHQNPEFEPIGKRKKRVIQHRKILDQYYLKNPLIARTIVIISGWILCAILLIAGAIPDQLCKSFEIGRCDTLVDASGYLTCIGTGLTIALILLAEASMFFLRRPRNKQLRKLYGINYYRDVDNRQSRARRKTVKNRFWKAASNGLFWFRKLMFDIKAS
jgi:hypothetical protein